MKFVMEHWGVDFPWVRRMEEIPVLGTTFSALLLSTMQNLIWSFGEPLRHQANLLTNANGPTKDYLFNAETMTQYLKNGDFKFSTGNKRLIIAGPTKK